METGTLRDFLKWCTIINVILLLFSSLMLIAVGDFMYAVHGQLFHMTNQAFDVVIYSLLGGYKILIFVFNLVPYVVLRIIERKQYPKGS